MRQASPGELGVGVTDTVRDLLIDLLSVWLLWGGGEGDGEFSNTSQLASMVQETLVLFCDEQPYIDNFSTVCSVCLENNFGWFFLLLSLLHSSTSAQNCVARLFWHVSFFIQIAAFVEMNLALFFPIIHCFIRSYQVCINHFIQPFLVEVVKVVCPLTSACRVLQPVWYSWYRLCL